MTWREAADFVMPFGQHKGKTLDAIATSDEGLRYLDWLRGDIEKPAAAGPARPTSSHRRIALAAALATYLDDESIASDLRKLCGADE